LQYAAVHTPSLSLKKTLVEQGVKGISDRKRSEPSNPP